MNNSNTDNISVDLGSIGTTDDRSISWPFNDGIDMSTITIVGSNDYSITSAIDKTGMYVEKNLEVAGDITVGGLSLTERLDRIEQRLVILRPNQELEKRWSELRELGDQYRALEQELTERDWIFDQLKK